MTPIATHVDDRPLWDIMMAAYHMPTLTVADEIGFFSRLASGPLSVEAMAGALDVPLRSIEAIADVLVTLGLCRLWDERLHLTPLARTCLLPDSPRYWGPMLLLWRTTTIDHARLLGAVRQGGGALPQQGTEDLWAVHSENMEKARYFTAAMNAHSLLPAQAVARSGEFASTRRLLDVGGGSGCFATAIARANPAMRATIMDIPAVCPIAEDYIREAGLADRVNAQSGDMFSADWPQGYDAIFFSNIFHDWNPDQCRVLARNAYAALPSGGRIHLNEMVKADGEGGPLAVACYSVDMLLYTEGRQYRGREIQAILEEAGFADIRFAPVSGYFWLISATRP